MSIFTPKKDTAPLSQEQFLAGQLQNLTASSIPIVSLAFTYNGDGTVNTVQFLDINSNVIFTLTFDWVAGQVTGITRS